jgi:hypothetical protein
MMQRTFRITGAVLVSLVGLALPGCGSGYSHMTGKITEKGAPLKLSDKGVVQLRFVGKDADDYYQADVQPDGSFTVVGRDGRGIPPGKYKVAVKVLDPYGPMARDRYNSRYDDKVTTLEKEVNGRDEIIVNLES